MFIKICGLKSKHDIDIINRYPIDYAGFIFAPSKRQITLETAKELKERLNPMIQSVGVFVNEPIENIIGYVRSGVIDRIQLHGDEDNRYIQNLKQVVHLPIIKAFRIKDKMSIENQKDLMMSPFITNILLDTWHPIGYGGTGQTFDWNLLASIKRPYFLSGGIGIETIDKALSYKPYGLDINSKVETNGAKDAAKIEALMKVIQETSIKEKE